MSVGLLEPVPTGQDTEGRRNSDEYWFAEDGECYLKLDFTDSDYTISWRTDYEAEEFLPMLEEEWGVSMSEGLVTIWADERDYVSVPAGDFLVRELEVPEDPGVVKYEESLDRGQEVEIEWFDYPSSSAHISVSSNDPELSGEFESLFDVTVDTDVVGEGNMSRAYAEAVERVRDRFNR